MWPNPQFPAVKFTEEILNGKLHFFCSAIQKGVFKNFERFTRKYLHQSYLSLDKYLFLDKVAGLKEIFKNIFLDLWATASEVCFTLTFKRNQSILLNLMLLNQEFIFLRKDMTMSMMYGHSVNNLQVLMNLMKMKQWMTVKIFRRKGNTGRNTEYIKILAKQVVKPLCVNVFWKSRLKEIGDPSFCNKFWNVFQNSFL